MSTTLTFELKLKSDYHVGSGRRKGTEIDSALLREADGRPALRGSLLGQMLRDSARELLATPAMAGNKYQMCKTSGGPEEPEYCGQWRENKGICPICHVFGTPRAPRRWQFSSAWLAELQAGQTADIRDADWGAQPVMRVRVSPATRRAEPDKLFSEEVGDGRLCFCFEASWQGNGEPDENEIALLAASAANMRHIGKSRRRGRGHCRVQLIAIDGKPAADEWLELFKHKIVDEKWQPEPVPYTQKKEMPMLGTESALPEWQPVRVPIIAYLDEPVLVARRASAGNQFDGLVTLPGTILLGALAARAARNVDLSDAGHYQKFVTLFRRGWARFSHLTLASEYRAGIYPAFAAPLDVFRCKRQPPHDSGREYFRAFSLLEKEAIRCDLCLKDDPDAEAAVEKVEGLLILPGGDIEELSVDKREEMHIRINPKTQRAEDGNLFEYVALKAGQYLRGEIVCSNRQAWDDLQSIAGLPESSKQALPLRLGKATSRGYGRVSTYFSFDEMDDLRKTSLYQQTIRERLPVPKEPFTLLCVTNTIIRDKWGRFPTRFEDDSLSEVLGMKVELKRGFAKSKEIDGFHNYLGLPRWRDRAFIAGSAAGIQVIDNELTNDEIWTRLERFELQGIGLRRHEGFGQIAINHPIYQAIKNPDSGASISIQWKKKKATKIAENQIEREREFRNDWQETLNQIGDETRTGNKLRWDQFEHKQFASVARLLRSGCNLHISKLKEELESLGKLEFEQLKRRIDYAAKAGESQTPAERESKKFFEKEDKGKPGIDLINKILDMLEQKIQDNEKLRAIGIEMLALKIAEAANRAVKEGRS